MSKKSEAFLIRLRGPPVAKQQARGPAMERLYSIAPEKIDLDETDLRQCVFFT
jgi:hypothetical protein